MVHNIEKWDGPSIGLRCIWLLVSNTIIKGSPSTFERARTLESKQESRRCAYEEQSSSPQSLSSERKHYSKRKKNSSETRDSWVHGWEISYSFVVATLVTPPCLTDNHSSAREEWDIGLYLFISGRIWTLRILPFVCFLCEYSKKWKVLFIMLKVTFCQWNKEIKMTQVEKFFGVVCRYSLPVIVVSLLPTPEH